MQPIWKDLDIKRKTSRAYELRFHKNNVALSIEGWTVYFTAKENMADSDANAKISKDITAHLDAINGKTVIELSTGDTDLTPQSYYYDIKFKDADGNAGILFEGRINISEPVTTRG